MQCDQSLNLQKMFVPWFALLIVGYRVFPSTKRVPFSLSLLFHHNWFCYIVPSSLFENSCKATRNIRKTALNPALPIMWQMVLLFTVYEFIHLLLLESQCCWYFLWRQSTLWHMVSQSCFDPLPGLRWSMENSFLLCLGSTVFQPLIGHFLFSTPKSQDGRPFKRLLY